MYTQQHTKQSMRDHLVCRNPDLTLYDVYLNTKEFKTTSSVWGKPQKNTAFFNTGKLVIGSKFNPNLLPELDDDARHLQSALLNSSTRMGFLADQVIAFMACSGMVYVTVSLCERYTA